MAPSLLARLDDLPGPGEQRRWTNLPGCGTALVIGEIAGRADVPLVVLASTVSQAEALEAQVRFFTGLKAEIALFPDLEILPYDSFSPHQDLLSARLRILRDLSLRSLRILVTAIPTLLPRLAPVQYLQRNAVQVRTGDALSLGEFQRTLDQAGYARVTQVAVHGDYAVRGSLVDFFPIGYEFPVRVDFLDETVDSLRSFDPDSQLSTQTLKLVDTLPARETPNDIESVTQFRQRYRRRFEGNPAQSVIYREVSERRLPGGIESYLPLFFETTAVFWEYLADDALVVSLGDTDASLRQAWQQAEERFEQLGSDTERPLLRPAEVYCPPEEHRRHMARRAQLHLDPDPPSQSPNHAHAMDAAPAPMVLLNPREEQPEHRLAQFLQGRRGRVLFGVGSPGRREWLHELLVRAGHRPVPVKQWPDFLEAGAGHGIAEAALDAGVSLPGAALTVLSEQELFAQPPVRKSRRRRGRDAEALIHDLTDLRVGSPVVHIDHGIGRYAGLTRMDIAGTPAEFVTLEYAGGDRLHVPVSALHLVSRYEGADAEHAPLHRLGTDQWQKARRRAAERVRDVAAELLEIYSKRAARPGRSAVPDLQGYEAFAAGFAFNLTEDQARAIDDVLADLASARPMDRLVCGDVGFGKTEVALRAAFAAASSGRQVAVLVPTTLLAQQHYETFADRFADWPMTIDVLSRFRGPQDQRRVLDRLAAGQIDIVVGTHRLLQKDVAFRDLALVIVDEEHRFGVRHKELLKKLRTEVDILTLTATPIPRTLNMALGGLREFSLIATPPESRLAIKTFLSTWSVQLIREACLRELKRGGQVYFVHNRVQDIASVADQVAKIVPEGRTRIAHGQMHERELESVMLDFYHRRFEILVCTAIIESGLDVPTANTIIIDHAEHFGLAQLHQLRGRVGRSDHQAFAYLIAPPGEALRGDARKRLEALEALGDLGAGFVLATHDLEIRGAGQLLGEDQSGQIQEIGFALYNEMLSRTVKALQNGLEPDPEAAGQRTADIELHVPALIPEEYLPDVHLRLVLYKRIANAASDDEIEALGAELSDRFGHLPDATVTLLRITALKLRALECGIARLQAGAAGGSVEFGADTRVDPVRLVKLIETDPKQFRLDPRQRLVFRKELGDPQERLGYVEGLLSRLMTVKAPPKPTARRHQGMAS
jgi:transcription-repair coupling factor (superfamily II helicase)